MSDDRKITLNEALVHALAGLGDANGKEAQEGLWRNGEAREHKQVIEARARHPETRAAALVLGLQDASWEVRARTLELILDGPEHERLVEGVEACLQDRSDKVQALAREVYDWTPPAQESALGELAGRLASEEEVVRHRARHAIRRGACQSGLEPVLAMLTHPMVEARCEARKALRYPNRVPAVLEALLACLDAKDPASKQLVGPSLGCCQDRERLGAELRRRAEGEDAELAAGAMYGLAYMADPSQRLFLERVATEARDGRQAVAAVLGLELMGAKESVTLLQALLDPYDPRDDEEYPYDEGRVDD